MFLWGNWSAILNKNKKTYILYIVRWEKVYLNFLLNIGGMNSIVPSQYWGPSLPQTTCLFWIPLPLLGFSVVVQELTKVHKKHVTRTCLRNILLFRMNNFDSNFASSWNSGTLCYLMKRISNGIYCVLNKAVLCVD